MSSVIYASCLDDVLRGRIDFGRDKFRVMLMTSGYEVDKGAHAKRSNIAKKEAAGPGYSAGGVSVQVIVLADDDSVEVELGSASWENATITARGAIYYKYHGSVSTLDELVAYIDFGEEVVSTHGSFELTASTIKLQN
jgi:hypothetical protein